MSTVAEELNSLRERISGAYEVVEDMGGESFSVKNTWNLSSAIDSIPQSQELVSFFGATSIAQIYPLSLNVENGQWMSIPNQQAPAFKFECPVKKIIGPNASANTSVGTNLPRGFMYMFGATVGLNSTTNSMGICSLNNWLPNVSCISFPELTEISGYQALGYLCRNNNNVRKVIIPKLSSIWGDYACSQAFAYTTLEPEGQIFDFANNITKIIGAQACLQMFHVISRPPDNLYNPKPVVFSKLTALAGAQVMQNFTSWNAGISSMEFPKLSVVGVSSTTATATYTSSMATLITSMSYLQHVDFPELLSIRGSQTFRAAFQNNSVLTSISFPKLRFMQNDATFYQTFMSCSSLTSITFPELLNISGNSGNPTFYQAFNNCKNLKEVRFPKLSAFMPLTSFSNLRDMQTISSGTLMPDGWKFYLPNLSSITAGTTSGANAGFRNNRRMTDIYLNSMTAIANKFLFTMCNELTGIHFSLSNQNLITATAGYSTKWGATNANCQVLFDL